MKIFYSWQKDSPAATNRTFIESALDQAAREIKRVTSSTVVPVVDRDTQGLTGAPDISEAILKKIDAADVFVADVTIITPTGYPGRPTCNPNVLFELGYAWRSLGVPRVIMVLNLEYGKVESLPFDIRANSVLTYTVSEAQTDKGPARASLKKALVTAIQAIADAAPKRPLVVERLRRTDVELFRSLLGVLAPQGSIEFLRTHNMRGWTFENKKLDDIRQFYYEWNDVLHKFHDPELEALRDALREKCGEYLNYLALNTHPSDKDIEWRSVPEDWEITNPTKFQTVVADLERMADSIIDLYTKLVETGRHKADD